MTIRSLPLSLALGAVLLLSLSACAGGGAGGRAAGGEPPAPTATSTGPEGHADVFSLHPGDCMNDSDDTEVSELPVVDCTSPHDFEAFSEFDLAGTDYPGDDAVSEEAHGTCADEFEPFVGIAYDSSKLDVRFLAPTEESWSELDDRTVVCLLFDPAGPLTGSAAGTGI
jgi:hypothetical protein